MPPTNQQPRRTSLYVCRDCGDGVENPDAPFDCPTCGGRLVDTSVPHD